MKIHDFHFSYIMNNKTLVCPVSNTANMPPSYVLLVRVREVVVLSAN